MKKVNKVGEGELTWVQAYGRGAGLILLALGSIWAYRFGSQLYDLVFQPPKNHLGQ